MKAGVGVDKEGSTGAEVGVEIKEVGAEVGVESI